MKWNKDVVGVDHDAYADYPVHVGHVDEATDHADLGGLEMDLHEDVDLSVSINHADDATEDEDEEDEEDDEEEEEEEDDEDDDGEEEDEYEEEEEADALMNPDLSISHSSNTNTAGGIHGLKSWKTRDPIYSILSEWRRLLDTCLPSSCQNNNHNFSIRHSYGKIQNEKSRGRGRGRKTKKAGSVGALTGASDIDLDFDLYYEDEDDDEYNDEL